MTLCTVYAASLVGDNVTIGARAMYFDRVHLLLRSGKVWDLNQRKSAGKNVAGRIRTAIDKD
jgi:hypothetical protein